MGKIYDALNKAEQEAKLIRKRRSASYSDDTASPQKDYQQKNMADILREQEKTQNVITKTTTSRRTQLQLAPRDLSSTKKKLKGFPFLNIFQSKATPPLKDNKHNFFTNEKQYSIIAEQYRHLRTKVQSFCKVGHFRTIMITSALPEEGKSTVAVNLSIGIANGITDSAFLMDCDMRRPTIHNFFQFNNKVGLSNLLRGDISIDEAIIKTEIDRLTILPAGTIAKNPSELISSKNMIDLIATLKSKSNYDYIIFDTPPLYQTQEPEILSKHIDGIIIVVKAGATSREIIKRAVEKLDKKKILGIVFNMAQESIKSYKYNYYSPEQQ